MYMTIICSFMHMCVISICNISVLNNFITISNCLIPISSVLVVFI